MTWALTTIFCVSMVEISVRLPLPAVISRITASSRKAMHTLGAKSVSDHWKEKALLAYSVSLLVSSMKLAACLAVIAAGAIFLIILFDYFGASVGEFLTDWPGVLFSLVVATLYFFIRKIYV